jgi:hypothetical protein
MKSDRSAIQYRRRKRRPADDIPAPRAPQVAGPEAGALLESGVLAHATASDSRQAALHGLQRSTGNRHVQRLIARAASEQKDAAQATAEPQTRDTDYGTFLVYPDDQPLSLDMARDPEREWPVTQAIFERLKKVVDIIDGGAAEIEIKGGSAFRTATLMDMEWLLTRPAGAELLAALAATNRKLTIEYAPSGAGLEAVAETAAAARPDGTPGPGSDVRLRYLTAAWSPAGGNQGWERREPAEGLAQMLIEALPLMSGSAPSPQEREPVADNAQATGLDRLKQAIKLENRFRGAFGLPPRPEE